MSSAGRGSRVVRAARELFPRSATILFLSTVLLLVPAALRSQERGAAALSEAVDGLGVTMRVLMIGAHPDDEDTNLLAWLAKGQHVQAAYLSLTRGDGGQNLIGNELGEGLGAIRTEELLAARRIDGAHQFFTRAYDFGFSKTAEETYRHWPHDTLLGDVVRVVREFRPHVIVAVFSGTPRDGHGHHQVSGMLAREVYEMAGDTARYTRAGFGAPWTPLKFYRSSRSNRADATLAVNVGEYDPVLGRSYAEIAGESRSQHKSQGFGVLEPKGPVTGYLRREATRVAAPEDASSERTMFDGIDVSINRLRAALCTARDGVLIDSLAFGLRETNEAFQWRRPASIIPVALRLRAKVHEIKSSITNCESIPAPGRGQYVADALRSLETMDERAQTAVLIASGVELELTSPREVIALNTEPTLVPYRLTAYDRGRDSLFISGRISSSSAGDSSLWNGYDDTARAVSPGQALVLDSAYLTNPAYVSRPSQPYWLSKPRNGDMFGVLASVDETRLPIAPTTRLLTSVGSPDRAATMALTAPVVRRYADPVRGDVSVPVAGAPAISVTLSESVEYVPANTELHRTVTVRLRSADTAQRTATVRLQLPRGLTADSIGRTVVLDGYDAQVRVEFQLGGRLAPGLDSIRVTVESGGETFATGYELVDYSHIRPRRIYRPATLALQSVDVTVPTALTVAYVPGVGDNVAPTFAQLGIPVTIIEPAALATTDLSRYAAVMVGPRAYQAYPEVLAARGKLLDYARAGGTLVVQYQQTEAQTPGVAPYPMTFSRPADRVTIEEAPVRVVDPTARVLVGPNRIGPADFVGWVQERSTYMPHTFDDRYQAPLEMHDPGEEPNRGALLVAPVGKGTYVYVTLSLFRQLPAGVPGAARILVNLLSAGSSAATAVVP